MPTVSKEHKEFFTSDTHFYHKNVIMYDNRPFDNVYEMNEALIKNWNAVVTSDDTVYHLGDVSFGSIEQIQNTVSRLNGYKILIRGNHDGTITRTKQLGFDAVYDDMLMNRGGKFIWLRHSPWSNPGHIDDYSDSHISDRLARLDVDIVLHGHIHTRGWKTLRNQGILYVNVGTMLHGYTPRTLSELTTTI